MTVRYKTTDADSNLWGIRPQVWHPGSGLFTNDGGAWSGASGGYAELVRSITLDRDGDWYFWTDAQDTPGVFANSGAWGDAYRIHVVQGAPPNAPPVASVVVDGQSHGATVTRPAGGSTNVTVRYRATDANGNLSGIRPQVWRPDGNLNNNGGAFVGQSGSSGEVAWTVTLNQDGNWYFWTDATDTTIAPDYVNSGPWSSGFRLNVVQGADTTPPGIPQPAASLIAAESFTVTWNNPGDNVGVTGYQWRLNGGAWNQTTATTQQLTGLTPGTAYTVQVQARDAAGNWSNGFGSVSVTTSSSGGGGGSSSSSFFTDVDGDGLYDEVVKPGSDGFTYTITQWFTENPSYSGLLVNNYWSPFGFHWLGGGIADGLLFRPDFSLRLWFPPPIQFSIETTFNLRFTLPTHANEPVALFTDPTDSDQVNPGNWQTIVPRTTFPSGGNQVVTRWFDGLTLPGNQFFLVRYGVPAAGARHTLGSLGALTSTGGTVTLPGGATVNLTTSTGVIMLPGGPSVSFSGGTVSVSGGGGTLAPGASVTILGFTISLDLSGNITITPPAGGPVQSISASALGGSASVVFSNGAGVSIAPGGQIGLSLPPGLNLPVLTEVINVAGRIQSGHAASAVKYVLKDLLGVVTPLPPPILDLGAVLAGGTKQLGIDNGGTVLWLTKAPQEPQPELEKVEWAQKDSALDTNPNAGGGTRIFAGKTAPNDTVNRQSVLLRAKLKTATANITVHFRIFDVDDPSANSSPVDDESNVADNRGGWSQPANTAVTNSQGIAEVSFDVSMQPGDNFRAVATIADPQALNSISAKQNDGTSARLVDGSGTILQSSPTLQITEMLTVWRHIHIETDSMGPVSGNTLAGNVTAVGGIFFNKTLTTDVNLNDSVDRFQPG